MTHIEKDLFTTAIAIKAERDLGPIEPEFIVDLLADNTDWSLDECKQAKFLVEDFRGRMRSMSL